MKVSLFWFTEEDLDEDDGEAGGGEGGAAEEGDGQQGRHPLTSSLEVTATLLSRPLSSHLMALLVSRGGREGVTQRHMSYVYNVF